MAKVKDVIEIIKNVTNVVTDVEVYFSISGKSNYHTDNLKHVDIDVNILYEEVLDYWMMDRDTYMRTKLILNAVAPQGRVRNFLDTLFAFVESKQPLLIEMKGGAV